MTRKAYSFVRTFAPEPARDLCVDRHYLLCASAGALRLEAQGQAWLLPPARAALIEAGQPIRVSIPQPVTTASVLFDTGFIPAPPASMTVFDLSPLARVLVTECGRWGESDEPLTAYAETLFAALAAVTWRLAEQPSPVVVPVGRSPELRRALQLTQERLGGKVSFEDVADEVGLAPRSLARRFEEETGMTWRAVLRRMRVLRAIEELAAADTPVTKIAFRVGYTSLSAFNAAFRELTGHTPTEYRASFPALTGQASTAPTSTQEARVRRTDLPQQPGPFSRRGASETVRVTWFVSSVSERKSAKNRMHIDIRVAGPGP